MLLRSASFALLLLCPSPAQDATPYPTPRSKKGLQVQMVDDALALGIAHAAVNVDLGALAYFAGLDVAQTAQALGVSAPTVKRSFAFARGWLRGAIESAVD